MSEPVVPRMPPPHRLALLSGILVVLTCLSVGSYIEFGLWFVAFQWALIGVWLSRDGLLGRLVRQGVLLWKLKLNAPAIVALHMKWSAQDIASETVATRADIAAFQQQTGMALPRDLRYYFTFVNGTRLGECGKDDEYGVGFWHFRGVSSFADTHVGSDPDAARLFAFADWSMRTAVYGVLLDADPSKATPVFASMPSGRVQVAASFTEFVERYLLDPRSVLSPEFDVVAVGEGIGTECDGRFICSIRWEDINAVSITLVRNDDETVRAMWVIDGVRPVSPLHSLVVPIVLSARATHVTERLRDLPGFDTNAFLSAVAAEQRDEAGTFLCWRHPDHREKRAEQTRA